MAVMLTACEKPFVGLIEEETPATPANLIVNVTGLDQVPFDEATTRSVADIAAACSRLNFVIYQGETKVQSVAQKRDDAAFGTFAISLPQGQYRMAIIGHSSEGTATISSLEKISFKNNRVTDTFLYSADIEVGEGTQALDVQLQRVVAMFRLVLTADLPENITQLKFYYTGGSSTLSALTGYGSVNSKQTVILPVSSGQRQFEVYTIPHAEEGVLKMTISALDASSTLIKERILETVPVRRNMITRYTGDFMDGSSAETAETSVQMQISTEWDGEDEYSL